MIGGKLGLSDEGAEVQGALNFLALGKLCWSLCCGAGSSIVIEEYIWLSVNKFKL